MASEPTHWAILIGVGVKTDPEVFSQVSEDVPRSRSLRGAVPDVVTIKEYLKSVSMPIDITMLADTEVPEGDNSSSKILPTYRNVVTELKKVFDSGKQGDFVYIHYSGHGTRRKVGPNASGALALVLYDNLCLYGEVLRSALLRMVERGMLVTLVLDCCFSGSVLRTSKLYGADIRFIEYDPSIDAKPEDGNPFAVATTTRDMRDAAVNNDWLLNPDKYTVIAACGPHNEAWEIEFPGGARRGALSYFLVDALKTLAKFDVQLSHQSFHQHLCARFHAEYPQQVPMRYGSSSFTFFRSLKADSGIPSVPVFRDVKDGSLLLRAGQAHGVHTADEYVAHQYHAPDNVDGTASQKSVNVVVKEAGSLTSELETSDSSDERLFEKGSTWKARRLNSIALHKVQIRLMPCLSDRKELAVSAEKHPFLCLRTEERQMGPCVFSVTVNNKSAYEVQDTALKTISNLPTIPVAADSSHRDLVDMLGHIATFKYFERIMNQSPNKSFEGSFALSCSYISGPDGCYEVKHGQTWSLTFENLDQSPKYLAIFNFSSSWKVSNLVSEAGEGDLLVVPPRSDLDSGKVELPLVMTVPDDIEALDEGSRKAEDIVKVFVTGKPTTFPSMVLPRLGQGFVRGGSDQLKRFLQGLSNNTSRAGDDEQNQWASRNFIIKTST